MTWDEIQEKLKKWGWPSQAVDLGVRADFRCEYCGRDLLVSIEDYDAWQVDHILPRAENRDEFWNLALACKTCNFLKRDSIPSTPIDPKSNRAHAIAIVREELINERRARKQAQVDSLLEMFRCAEWPAMREAVIATKQTDKP